MVKRNRSEPRARLAPTQTVAHLTDDFIAELSLPQVGRASKGIQRKLVERTFSLLHELEGLAESKYDLLHEVVLIEEAQRCVFAHYELDISESEIKYASFRKIVEGLGYERNAAGFTKKNKLSQVPPRVVRQKETAIFIDSLNIKRVTKVSDRIETQIKRRTGALLYHLDQANRDKYVGAVALRLFRDAHRIILTEEELGIRTATDNYSTLENLAEQIGYVPAHVGFKRK